MEPTNAQDPTIKEQEQALETAKSMIRMYFEKYTGVNLYGIFPDRSIWNFQEYQKAAKMAKSNAEKFNRPLISEMITKHLTA